ncbi:MAG: OmpA family protein [Gammaproteobacteria bacterium]|nr:OmpA family protein [Gammaproteobacteria bacterium]MDH5651247.1 OmpA family protein [Gammaproteobacteria bacterium]
MQNVFFTICLISAVLSGCAISNSIHNKEQQFFGLTQVRGTPNQFYLCTDCPLSTPKTPRRKFFTSAISQQPEKKTIFSPKKVLVHFDHAASILHEDDKTILARLAKVISQGYRLTITGYTDSTGKPHTNKILAKQRAQVVRDYLRGLGVDKQHITLKSAPLCCYVATNTTNTGRALNRRTEIIITQPTKEEI